MASSATKGAGTLLQKGGTTIAEVTNIGGPGMTRDTYNTTYHGGTWQEYVAGLPDAGEITIDLNFLPANTNQSHLQADMTATAQTYQVLFSDAATTTWTVTGLVTNCTPAAPVDGKLGLTATLKLTGPVTFA